MPTRDIQTLSAALASPGVHVITVETPSRSHFGGSPMLPPGTAWPERHGARLAFLARLSLSEVQRAHPIGWLPETGALLFFYDVDEQPWGFEPKDRGGHAILLVPDLPSPLEQVSPAPNGEVSPLRPQRIGFRRIDTLPSPERDPVKALDLTRKEMDAYFEACDAPFGERPKHQIAGHPAPVQGDEMELECQLVSHGLYCGDGSGYRDPRAAALRSGARSWRLLFQLDTDDELNLMWGDCGTIYFWVREDDARAGNFEGSWLILQCC
jgi:uncharacterized protein YwqG